GGHADLHLLHARQGSDELARLALHLTLHRAGRSGQLDLEAHLAVVDHHVLDEPARDDVAPQVGILDARERRQYLLLGYGRAGAVFARLEPKHSSAARSIAPGATAISSRVDGV